MAGFIEAVLERVLAARAALQAALEAKDAFGAAVAQDELDDALQLADSYGIDAEAEEGDPDAGTAL